PPSVTPTSTPPEVSPPVSVAESAPLPPSFSHPPTAAARSTHATIPLFDMPLPWPSRLSDVCALEHLRRRSRSPADAARRSPRPYAPVDAVGFAAQRARRDFV